MGYVTRTGTHYITLYINSAIRHLVSYIHYILALYRNTLVHITLPSPYIRSHSSVHVTLQVSVGSKMPYGVPHQCLHHPTVPTPCLDHFNPFQQKVHFVFLCYLPILISE